VNGQDGRSVIDNSNTDPNRRNVRVTGLNGGFDHDGTLIFFVVQRGLLVHDLAQARVAPVSGTPVGTAIVEPWAALGGAVAATSRSWSVTAAVSAIFLSLGMTLSPHEHVAVVSCPGRGGRPSRAHRGSRVDSMHALSGLRSQVVAGRRFLPTAANLL
jgi:hypothetical protein